LIPVNKQQLIPVDKQQLIPVINKQLSLIGAYLLSSDSLSDPLWIGLNLHGGIKGVWEFWLGCQD